MSYLDIELARTIDEDRYREAERCLRTDQATSMRQKQRMNPVQTLVRWLQSLAKQERHLATEQQIMTLAELS